MRQLLVRVVLFVSVLLFAAIAGAQERITFRSLDADLAGGRATTVTGFLYRPHGAGPFPAVVGMHGCGGLIVRKGRMSGTVTPTLADWAKRLSAAGYVVLLPDSFSPRHIGEICTVKERGDIGRERVLDAYGALEWLQAQRYVVPDRVGLVGWSHGGGVVIRSVDAKSESRPAVLPHGGFRAAVAFYPVCPDPKRNKAGREWRSAVPLLILMGAADDWTPPERCRNLAETVATRDDDVTVHLYPGAYHAFDSLKPVQLLTGMATAHTATVHAGQNPAARADAIERVPAFLHRYLGG
jgi:dienelactone hydrolase